MRIPTTTLSLPMIEKDAKEGLRPLSIILITYVV